MHWGKILPKILGVVFPTAAGNLKETCMMKFKTNGRRLRFVMMSTFMENLVPNVLYSRLRGWRSFTIVELRLSFYMNIGHEWRNRVIIYDVFSCKCYLSVLIMFRGKCFLELLP